MRVQPHRPGYFGFKKEARIRELNERFGEDNWKLAWKWGDKFVSQEAAWQLYEDAYFHYFENHPLILQDILERASDVYDLNPRDVESGLDYTIQKESAVHLQDIAIRRAVRRLGEEFKGSKPLQVRGKDSPLSHLNPGIVPFHEPYMIERPRLHGFWEGGSVEDFYQSNKYVISKP